MPDRQRHISRSQEKPRLRNKHAAYSLANLPAGCCFDVQSYYFATEMPSKSWKRAIKRPLTPFDTPLQNPYKAFLRAAAKAPASSPRHTIHRQQKDKEDERGIEYFGGSTCLVILVLALYPWELHILKKPTRDPKTSPAEKAEPDSKTSPACLLEQHDARDPLRQDRSLVMQRSL